MSENESGCLILSGLKRFFLQNLCQIHGGRDKNLKADECKVDGGAAMDRSHRPGK